MLFKCYHKKLLASYILFAKYVKYFEQGIYFNILITIRYINELQLNFVLNINKSPDQD